MNSKIIPIHLIADTFKTVFVLLWSLNFTRRNHLSWLYALLQEKYSQVIFTIIPSAKKWVFHAIPCLAFLGLYGESICLVNRLVLTDIEDAEYSSYELLISTHYTLLSSKDMLCTFIWDIYGVSCCNLISVLTYVLMNSIIILFLKFSNIKYVSIKTSHNMTVQIKI